LTPDAECVSQIGAHFGLRNNSNAAASMYMVKVISYIIYLSSKSNARKCPVLHT